MTCLVLHPSLYSCNTCSWFFRTKSYTGFTYSGTLPTKNVLVMSEQYPLTLHPMSIVIISCSSIFLSVGTACGFDVFSPDATIVSNETPSVLSL